MICIYLDDKLSSKLMEDDQDEMDDTYRWSGWNGWYLSRLWYVFT